MLTIEEIIKKLSDRNLSEVARRLHITRTYLADIANGKRVPSGNMLARISEYLEKN